MPSAEANRNRSNSEEFSPQNGLGQHESGAADSGNADPAFQTPVSARDPAAPPSHQDGTLLAAGIEADLGGLIDSDGADSRREKPDGELDEEAELEGAGAAAAKGKNRRQGAWRGIKASRDAYITYDSALRTLTSKVQALVLGSELRLYLVFIVMFCFFFLFERDITDNFYFSRAFKDPLIGSEIALIKRPYYWADISQATDFTDWIQDVFLNQMIDMSYPTGSNFLVGAFRVRTQRVSEKSCDINNAIIPKTMPQQALKCYGQMSTDNADDGTAINAFNQVRLWRFKSCDDWGHGSPTTGQFATYDCGGYSISVPWWRPKTQNSLALRMPFPSELYERVPLIVVRDLYIKPVVNNNPPFLDNLATRFATVEFFAYQPNLQTFFSFKLFAEQAAGGLWHPQYQARVFDYWTPSPGKVIKLIFDCFFALFVFFYVYRFIADFLAFRRKETKLLGFFFSTWNILEIVNISIFLAVFGFRVAWIHKSLTTDLEINKLVYSDAYPAQLDDILQLYMFQIYLNSMNTVLTFLKFLKFFRLNARLNVLTRTLAESQDSIIGVLLIFFLVVTAFALTGHGLFGLGVWEFRSIDTSFSTLLLMLVGQFNYENMKNENRVLSSFFFWGFIILGLFCLLNFLIGVLMEAFAEVSRSRTILPLEDVLVKTWNDLRIIFHPTTLRRTIVTTCKGESRSDLLEKLVDIMQTHRRVAFPNDTPDDEEKQLVNRAMIYDALPDELVEKLGASYIDYVWSDLVYEWDQSEGAQGAVDAQRDLILTARGVRAAIGVQLDELERLPRRLSKLEADLGHIVKIIDERGGLDALND